MPPLDVPIRKGLGVNPVRLKGKTPVIVSAMLPWFNLYPNREASEGLYAGFIFGFFIPSARDHNEVLRDKIRLEVELGRVIGSFAESPFYNLRVSPLGVVPKKEPGKFRLIHHLSHGKFG